MNRRAWYYYLGFYRGEYHKLFITIIFSITQSLMILPIAFLVRYAFDKVIPGGSVHNLLIVGIVILVLIILNSILTLCTRYLSINQTKLVIRDIREELLIQCYRCARSFYSTADLAKIHASIVQDTKRLDCMSNAIISLFLPSLIVAVGLCGVLMYISGSLFLVIVFTIPPLYLMNRVLIRKRRVNWVNASHRSFEKFSKGVLFVLQMMDLTRIQTAEQFEINQQKEYLEEVRVTGQANAMLFAAYGSVQNGIIAVSSILILIIGGMAVGSGRMTMGALISFYVAVSLLSGYVKTMLSAVPQIIEGNESLSTLYNIQHIDEPTPYSGHQSLEFKGEVILENVDFSYGDKDVLHSVNLTIKSASRVAVIGPNGAGKSTIIHLIIGFYLPQKGLLYADGVPYEIIDIIHLRQSIGVVMQDPIIFPGTIRENIVYGYPDAGIEDIIKASELATAHEFIQTLPGGYDTFMGEKGILLSGGQRQRIAIARALLRRPKLLILDEPTNHLDQTIVDKLMHNLKSLDEKPSILIVTQNMNVAAQADRIYILYGNGRIIDSANHEEILDFGEHKDVLIKDQIEKHYV